MAAQKVQKGIKRASALLVLGALLLQLLQAMFALPAFLLGVAAVTKVALAIHAVEGLVGAILILRYKLRLQTAASNEALLGGAGAGEGGDEDVSLLLAHLPESLPLSVVKAGLYVFFVGTVGLLEIVRAVKPMMAKAQAAQ